MLGGIVDAVGQTLFFSFLVSLLDRVCVVVVICYRIAFDIFHDLFYLSSRAVKSQHESAFKFRRLEADVYILRAFLLKQSIKNPGTDVRNIFNVMLGHPLPFTRFLLEEFTNSQWIKIAGELFTASPNQNSSNPVHRSWLGPMHWWCWLCD